MIRVKSTGRNDYLFAEIPPGGWRFYTFDSETAYKRFREALVRFRRSKALNLKEEPTEAGVKLWNLGRD